MTQIPKIRARTAGAFVAAAVVVACTACSPPEGSDLNTLQKMAATCPSKKIDQLIADDISGTGRGSAIITRDRHAAIDQLVTTTAVCRGHLRVVAFSASAAASTVVFDDDLAPEGATQIAHLRKVSKIAGDAMATIDKGLESAAKTIPADGSDVTGQLTLAHQYVQQLGSTSHTLRVHIFTDGVQTTGVTLNSSRLTEVAALSLARTVRAPSLPTDTEVSIIGLGRTSAGAAPTSYTNALAAFYTTVCHRTGARRCVAAIDFTEGN